MLLEVSMIVFPALGSALCWLIGALVVLHSYRRRRRFRKLAELAVTTGRVVRVSRNNDGGVYSVMEFEDRSGSLRTVICDLGQKRNVVGATATVAYDPSVPTGEALVRDQAENVTTGWIVGSIFMALGTVLLAVTILDALGVKPP